MAVAVGLGVAVWTELGALQASLASFPLALLPAVLALTVGNQALRFWRWERLLDAVDVDLPLASSARIFTSGLAMVLTPGKLGEVWKGWLARDSDGVPLERTLPVVGVERLTDVLGVLALSLTGVVAFGGSAWTLAGLAAGLVGLILVLQRDTWVLGALDRLQGLPGLGGLARRLEGYYRPARELLRSGPLTVALVLSVVGWSLECLGTWLVLEGLGAEVSLSFAAFAFALASILGAVSMLPGGLGLTEASMIGLLVQHGVGEATAAAATLIVRASTLWFVAGTALAVHGAHEARKGLTTDPPRPVGGSP